MLHDRDKRAVELVPLGEVPELLERLCQAFWYQTMDT